jgi:hypothetical protein
MAWASLRGTRMQLEISEDERALLEKLLESALSETRVVVRRTSTQAAHDELVLEEGRLRALLERMRAGLKQL